MREKYESLPLATLRDLAKAREITGISTLKKAELIERMLEEDVKDKAVLEILKGIKGVFPPVKKDIQAGAVAIKTVPLKKTEVTE